TSGSRSGTPPNLRGSFRFSVGRQRNPEVERVQRRGALGADRSAVEMQGRGRVHVAGDDDRVRTEDPDLEIGCAHARKGLLMHPASAPTSANSRMQRFYVVRAICAAWP